MGSTDYIPFRGRPEPRRPRRADPGPPLTSPGGPGLDRALRADLPGYTLQNRWEQAQHYKDLVYVGITKLMRCVQSATAQLMRRRKKLRGVVKALAQPHRHGGDEQFIPDERHPFAGVLRRPNPLDTFSAYLCQFLLQDKLHGQVVNWGPRNDPGHGPSRLWVLPTSLAWPQPAGPQWPRGAWRVSMVVPFPGMGQVMTRAGAAYGGYATLDNREVYVFRRANPIYRWDGYAPLTGFDRQNDLLENLDRGLLSAINNGVNASFVLGMTGFSRDEVAAAQELLRQRNAGPDNAGRPLAIGTETPDGDVKVQPFPQSAAPLGTDQWERLAGVVLGALGLTLQDIGLKDTSDTAAAVYARGERLYLETLEPDLNAVADFLTHGPMADWGVGERGYRVQIDLPRRTDPERQQRELDSAAEHSTRTVNEIRGAQGLEPLEGGDLPPAVYAEWLKAKVLPQGGAGQGGPQGGPQGGQEQGPGEAAAGPAGGATEQGAADAGNADGADSPGTPDEPPTDPGQLAAWLSGQSGQSGQPESGQGGQGGIEDQVTGAALRSLGVPQQKAFDSSRHPRDHGRFSHTSGGTAPKPTPAAAPPAPVTHPTAVLAQKAAEPKIRAEAAALAPVVRRQPNALDRLRQAQTWASGQADRHADKVAAHLGIPRDQAHALLADTIRRLAHAALAHGQARQTLELGGKRLTLGVAHKPTRQRQAATQRRVLDDLRRGPVGTKKAFGRAALDALCDELLADLS